MNSTYPQKKIKELREERGWTINELSSRAGLASGTMYNWGEDKKPTFDSILAACNAFEISMSEFFAENLNEQIKAKTHDLCKECEGLTPDQIEVLISVARAMKK